MNAEYSCLLLAMAESSKNEGKRSAGGAATEKSSAGSTPTENRLELSDAEGSDLSLSSFATTPSFSTVPAPLEANPSAPSLHDGILNDKAKEKRTIGLRDGLRDLNNTLRKFFDETKTNVTALLVLQPAVDDEKNSEKNLDAFFEAMKARRPFEDQMNGEVSDEAVAMVLVFKLYDAIIC